MMQTPSTPKLVVTLLAATSVALLVSACGKKDADKAAETKAEPPRPVRTFQVGETTLNDITFLPGEVRPRFEQRYGFRVPGKISKRLVDVGQEVKAGQVLAVLDSQDVLPAINAQSAQVDVAKTDLTLQQSELKRQQELRDKGFVSGASLERQAASAEAANARVKAAQSQLASAQNGLSFQTLRADKAGVVVAVDAEAGSVVAAGQSVVRVAQIGEREVIVNVPERAVGQMKAAKGFAVAFDAIPAKAFVGKLRELAPAADPLSRTYPARLALANADDGVKIGMSATVRMDLGEQATIVVPNTALYTRDNSVRVWVVDRASQTVQPVEVKTGESTLDGVAITSGLKAGDVVVTAGANLLLAGQKVRVLDSAPSAPSVPSPTPAPSPAKAPTSTAPAPGAKA
jgi:membrane fusion protein, multidrug efflux system